MNKMVTNNSKLNAICVTSKVLVFHLLCNREVPYISDHLSCVCYLVNILKFNNFTFSTNCVFPSPSYIRFFSTVD